MRVRFPIPVKLLAGFLANVALIAVGFWLVFRAQFGGISGDLMEGIMEPRLQSLAERIAAELREHPQARWASILQAHSEPLGIELSLFNSDIEPMVGPQGVMPADLLAAVTNKLTPHLRRRGGGEGGRPPSPPPSTPRGLSPLDDIFGPAPPPDSRPPPPQDRDDDRERGPPPMEPSMARYPTVLGHTTSPPGYWAVIRVPAVASERGYLPALLVVRSDTLSAGGVFLDPKPWLYAGVGVLVVSALIWMPIALGFTHSLRRLRTATGRVAEGDFAVEVPDANRRDELGELGRSVQQMAERLGGHAEGQKRFLGDIAHELCSPIARMQASLGILQQRAAADEKTERYMGKLAGELQHMSVLVNELLSFSKANLRSSVELKPVSLAPLIRRTLAREDASEEAGTARLEVPENCAVLADEELLSRAIGNLVRNSQRYAAGSGPVEIRATQTNGHVSIVVSDRGPGVPAEALPRLLEPFYRPDAARTRESGGVGLGLAIVKSCTEACGGKVEIANRQGGGLEVTLMLVADNGEAKAG